METNKEKKNKNWIWISVFILLILFLIFAYFQNRQTKTNGIYQESEQKEETIVEDNNINPTSDISLDINQQIIINTLVKYMIWFITLTALVQVIVSLSKYTR